MASSWYIDVLAGCLDLQEVSSLYLEVQVVKQWVSRGAGSKQ